MCSAITRPFRICAMTVMPLCYSNPRGPAFAQLFKHFVGTPCGNRHPLALTDVLNSPAMGCSATVRAQTFPKARVCADSGVRLRPSRHAGACRYPAPTFDQCACAGFNSQPRPRYKDFAPTMRGLSGPRQPGQRPGAGGPTGTALKRRLI